MQNNLEIVLDKDKMPTHIAIICDGNRRAARTSGLSDLAGHQKGAENVVELLREARNLGVKYITLWGFSTENWDRSNQEVSYLMELFTTKISELGKEFIDNKVAFRHLGRKDRLPKKLLEKLTEIEQKTAEFTERFVNVALDYGGKNEIVRAVKKIIKDKIDIEKIDEALISSYMDTAGIPEVDVLIRTGGEHRTSGYLIWQTTYAEMFFVKKFIPDFKIEDLKQVIYDFQNRDRRFGKDSALEDENYKMVSKV